MRTTIRGALLVLFGLALAVLTAVPVLAHHSFTAEFDVEKSVEFTGVITEMDWYNPHIYMHIDATEANGNILHWRIEGGSTAKWHSLGLNKNMLTPGTTVKMRAYGAKDGTKNLAFFRDMTILSGKYQGQHYAIEIGGLDENGNPLP